MLKKIDSVVNPILFVTATYAVAKGWTDLGNTIISKHRSANK